MESPVNWARFLEAVPKTCSDGQQGPLLHCPERLLHVFEAELHIPKRSVERVNLRELAGPS
ncbi:hypothetical protein TWF703_000778 [Orbilia oligospora]|uniref:Uncharacterized protein n=1 Tax=Orbilia oligospora TaxID=2813651 RepID=A0A7C8P256_ORBOL|nr:hypothetical protein TWF703_000778 [Orbilia oligospora]